MPMVQWHAARIEDPDKYIRIRYEKGKFGPGIDAVWGVRRDGNVELQAVRFDANKFTPDDARKWLAAKDMEPIDFVPAEPGASIVAAFQFAPPDAKTEIVSESTPPDGQKRARLRKEIARVGSYVHPTTGQAFSITSADIARWVSTFGRMQLNGVKVPLQVGHEIQDDTADKNRGWLYDMQSAGPSLFAYVEVIGADAITEALRNDVSLYSPPEWIDGKGNVYNRPIVHVALHPYPVLPGLGAWQVLAASFTGEPPQEKPMKEEDRKMNLEQVKAMAKMLGMADADVTALTLETAGAKIEAAVKALVASLTDAQGKATAAAQSLALATVKDDPIPDAVLELGRENRTMKVNGLVEAGRVNPACADKRPTGSGLARPCSLADS